MDRPNKLERCSIKLTTPEGKFMTIRRMEKHIIDEVFSTDIKELPNILRRKFGNGIFANNLENFISENPGLYMEAIQDFYC